MINLFNGLISKFYPLFYSSAMLFISIFVEKDSKIYTILVINIYSFAFLLFTIIIKKYNKGDFSIVQKQISFSFYKIEYIIQLILYSIFVIFCQIIFLYNFIIYSYILSDMVEQIKVIYNIFIKYKLFNKNQPLDISNSNISKQLKILIILIAILLLLIFHIATQNKFFIPIILLSLEQVFSYAKNYIRQQNQKLFQENFKFFDPLSIFLCILICVCIYSFEFLENYQQFLYDTKVSLSFHYQIFYVFLMIMFSIQFNLQSQQEILTDDSNIYKNENNFHELKLEIQQKLSNDIGIIIATLFVWKIKNNVEYLYLIILYSLILACNYQKLYFYTAIGQYVFYKILSQIQQNNYEFNVLTVT